MSDPTTLQAFVGEVESLERYYIGEVNSRFSNDFARIKEWYEMANLVKKTWAGKMGVDPRNELSSWSQVGEVIFVGWLFRTFPEWEPAGLPIGSETRVLTRDALIHFDVKTHREGDSDLDRTQDIRPEQISGEGDYANLFSKVLPLENDFIYDMRGKLGKITPKLPPYYVLGPGDIRTCITLFVVFVYNANVRTDDRFLNRVQIVCVPNGLVRRIKDYREIFQVGKDGRYSHRYRVNLQKLKRRGSWRWVEVK